MKSPGILFLAALLTACSDNMAAPPPPPEAQTVSVAYCDGIGPLWLAFQDGEGAWTRVQPTVTNGSSVFQYTFFSNRGAVATVFDAAPGTTSLQVLYGAPQELATVGINSPRFCEPAAVKTLLGTVTGLGDNEVAIIRGGFISEDVVHPGEGFALDVLPPGPRDILAARATSTDGAQLHLIKFILRRAVDLPDGASLPVIDFDAPEAFAPVVANVTLEGVGQDGAFVLTRLRTSNFESQFSLPIPHGSDVVQPYYALPEGQLLPGDLQALIGSTHGGTPSATRSARLYFRAPSDRTLNFGPDVFAPAIRTVATTPSLRLSAQFTLQADYDRATSIFYQSDGPSAVGVSMTGAYAASIGGYELVIPEFSGVAGFNQAWALHSVPSLRWSASRIGGTLGFGLDPVPTDGATQRTAFATDVITP